MLFKPLHEFQLKKGLTRIKNCIDLVVMSKQPF